MVVLCLLPLHPLKKTLLKYEVYWEKKVSKKISLEMKKWNRRSKMTRELSHSTASHRIASSFSKNFRKMKAKYLIGTSTHTSTSRKNLLCHHKCYFETFKVHVNVFKMNSTTISYCHILPQSTHWHLRNYTDVCTNIASVQLLLICPSWLCTWNLELIKETQDRNSFVSFIAVCVWQ